MKDFFNDPQRCKLLLGISHMEHGIKVNKNNVYTYKYNFGISPHNLNVGLMKDCLQSVNYPLHIVKDIMNHITTVKDPYSGFGIENQHIEFYIESGKTPKSQQIVSWNLSSGIKYIYTFCSIDRGIAILQQYIDQDMFDIMRSMYDDIIYVYEKLPYDKNTESEYIFNLYFKNKFKVRVHYLTDQLLGLLYRINQDPVILEYLMEYRNWILHWIHISMKKNGDLQITPYFRKVYC